jgi:hypothetical protein
MPAVAKSSLLPSEDDDRDTDDRQLSRSALTVTLGTMVVRPTVGGTTPDEDGEGRHR